MQKQQTGENCVTRREFVGAAAALGVFSIVPRHILGGSGQPAPSEKLNLGCIGVGGMQGFNDVRSVASQNIYALCDVDEDNLTKQPSSSPKPSSIATSARCWTRK